MPIEFKIHYFGPQTATKPKYEVTYNIQ
jgi:hypothetical protein